MLTKMSLCVLAVCLAVPALAAPQYKGEELKPMWWEGEDFSWIRGTNYISGFARNSVAQWEKYDPEVVDRELSYAQKLDLNSVRVWLNYLVYEKDPEKFMNNVEDLLSRCEKYGITAMLVIFDGCFGDNDPNFVTQGWPPNPGPTRMLPDYKPQLKKYVDALVKTHMGDPRILFWDIMNEPSSLGIPEVAKGDPEFGYDFAREWADYVREIDRTHPVTIGVGNHSHIPKVFDHVDVVNFHCYQPFEKTYRMDIAAARELAKDKALVLTETSTNEMGSTPELNFRMLEEANIGWYFFSLIMGECPVTHAGSVVTSEGVVLYPDYVCALLGFDVPREMMEPRLDRFRIADILRNIDENPTNAENFDEYRKAMWETGRSLGWAGVKEESGLPEAIKALMKATSLRGEGKDKEAYAAMDKGIKMMDEVVRKVGIYEELYAPKLDNVELPWRD